MSVTELQPENATLASEDELGRVACQLPSYFKRHTLYDTHRENGQFIPRFRTFGNLHVDSEA